MGLENREGVDTAWDLSEKLLKMLGGDFKFDNLSQESRKLFTSQTA